MRLRKFHNYGYTKICETDRYVVYASGSAKYFLTTHCGLLLGEKMNFDEPTIDDFEKWYGALRKRAVKNISSYNNQINELEETVTELYDAFDMCPVGDDDND